MRETTGRNAPEVAKVAAFSQAHGVDLRTVELDVLSQDSVEHAMADDRRRQGQGRDGVTGSGN